MGTGGAGVGPPSPYLGWFDRGGGRQRGEGGGKWVPREETSGEKTDEEHEFGIKFCLKREELVVVSVGTVGGDLVSHAGEAHRVRALFRNVER